MTLKVIPTFNQNHPKIIQATFSFPEFISVLKKSNSRKKFQQFKKLKKP